MKNETGVTLVALVITIIVLIILAGIGIGATTGINGNIQEAKTNLAISELSQVQQAVLETYIKYRQTNNSNSLIGIEITYSEAEAEFAKLSSGTLVGIESTDVDKVYYKLTPTELEELGIQNSEDTYIVNYYTGEVFNITTQKTTDGQVLYVNTE